MVHGHLPILISRLGAVIRHVSHLYQSATRMIELGFYSIQTGRQPKQWRRRRQPPGLRQQRRRPWLIHYHIFKNAGTSFEWALKEAFGSALHSYDPASADRVLLPAQIASYVAANRRAKVIVSHQAILPAPHVRGCSTLSSILIRDPVARIRSIYAF